MRKTYVTTMPDHIGAFLKASQAFAELGVNITRVRYNKAIDVHTLFIDAERKAFYSLLSRGDWQIFGAHGYKKDHAVN